MSRCVFPRQTLLNGELEVLTALEAYVIYARNRRILYLLCAIILGGQASSIVYLVLSVLDLSPTLFVGACTTTQVNLKLQDYM